MEIANMRGKLVIDWNQKKNEYHVCLVHDGDVISEELLAVFLAPSRYSRPQALRTTVLNDAALAHKETERVGVVVGQLFSVFTNLLSFYFKGQLAEFQSDYRLRLDFPHAGRKYRLDVTSPKDQIRHCSSLLSIEESEKLLNKMQLDVRTYKEVYKELGLVPYSELAELHKQRRNDAAELVLGLSSTGEETGDMVGIVINPSHIISLLLEDDVYLLKVLQQCREYSLYQRKLSTSMRGFCETGELDFTWDEKKSGSSLNLKIRIPYITSDDGFDAAKTGVRSAFFEGGFLRLLLSQEHKDFYPYLLGKIPEEFESLAKIFGSSYNALFVDVNQTLFERELSKDMLEALGIGGCSLAKVQIQLHHLVVADACSFLSKIKNAVTNNEFSHYTHVTKDMHRPLYRPNRHSPNRVAQIPSVETDLSRLRKGLSIPHRSMKRRERNSDDIIELSPSQRIFELLHNFMSDGRFCIKNVDVMLKDCFRLVYEKAWKTHYVVICDFYFHFKIMSFSDAFEDKDRKFKLTGDQFKNLIKPKAQEHLLSLLESLPLPVTVEEDFKTLREGIILFLESFRNLKLLSWGNYLEKSDRLDALVNN